MQAPANKGEGLSALYNLKSEGKLSEYDDKYLKEAENEVKDIESTIRR
ncbi:MAG: hypothetical protein KIS76_10775 [Pyrinomonadaceae bacterium]|nr:hypothetical protein [Pyrinomonadaceae bacterium]